MQHFVTLFDSLYLPQGLALQKSMERHLENYTLWVLCMDQEVFSLLKTLRLRNVKLLELREFETVDLLSVKKDRTKAEYCWTITPFAPKFVFQIDKKIDQVTYLDADLWFRKSPIDIFDEFQKSKKSILITDHSYAPEYDQSQTSGQYCVQFMTYKRKGSEKVRTSWENQCLDWCYAKYEKGRFGDQKYLDTWPTQFKDSIHILQNKELILAPWNATRFPFGNSIIWHFQGLKLIRKRSNIYAHPGFYKLPKVTIRMIYDPYFEDLKSIITGLEEIGFRIPSQASSSWYKRLKFWTNGPLSTFNIPFKLRKI